MALPDVSKEDTGCEKQEQEDAIIAQDPPGLKWSSISMLKEHNSTMSTSSTLSTPSTLSEKEMKNIRDEGRKEIKELVCQLKEHMRCLKMALPDVPKKDNGEKQEQEDAIITQDLTKLKWPSISRLTGQTSTLSEQEVNNIRDEELNEIKEIVGKLKEHIPANTANDANDRLNHWEYVSTRLLMNCLALRGEEAKQEEAIQELEDWKMIQDERIASMQEEPFPNGGKSSSLCQSSGSIKDKGGHASFGQSLRAGLQRSVSFVKGGAKSTSLDTSFRPGPERGSVASLPVGRTFANKASLDLSFKASLERAVTTSQNMNEQIRAEAKIEILAIKELLALRDSNKVELNYELFMMKAILKSTYDQEAKKGDLIFGLSCRKCKTHMNFMGKAIEQDLNNKVRKQFDQVVKAVQSKDCNAGHDPSAGPNEMSSKFAEHFAKHCKPAKLIWKSASETAIIKFLLENVKVEVLQRRCESEMYWEYRNEMYQLRDIDCE